MRVIRTILVLATCSAVAMGQAPPLHPWTLHEALEYFRAKSPAMAAAREQVAATQANEVTAALRVNPVFSSANEDFRAFTPPQSDIANTQEFTDSMAWTFERGGKRHARVQSAKLDTKVAHDTFRDTQRQLEFQLKCAFVNFLLAKSVLKLAQDNVADYQRTVEANAFRLQAGDISQTDFDRIKVEESQFQSDLLNSQLSLMQSRLQLETLLGLPYSPQFDIEGTTVPPELAFTPQDLTAKALASRPDYLAAVDSVHKAEADVKLANANGSADLVLAPEYKRNGPDNTLGVSLQFQIRLFDRNQGEKLRTEHVLESSHFSENAARIQTNADVMQALEGYRVAKQLSQLYSSDYLDRAKNVRDRMEFSYQHGAVNLLDYLDAVRSYREVELAAMQANAQVWLAVHQLSFATATELLP